jgi:predicted methyltransferase
MSLQGQHRGAAGWIGAERSSSAAPVRIDLLAAGVAAHAKSISDLGSEMLKHGILACLLALSAIAATPVAISQTAPDYAAIIATPDRSDADRKLDTNRAPAQWLAFIGVKPGMRILDIFAVYGWKAELLARAVAPDGRVYAQNSEAVLARVKDRLEVRLKTSAAANIISVVRPFEDPAPPGMHDFDVVTFFYAYHDITRLGVDRAKMNKALYEALKPDGELVVGDYSAKPGAGTGVVETLHRSDEALVSSEIEAAGFKLIDHGDFLRVPGDSRDDHSHSSAQPVDIYMLKFRKPG